MYGLEEIVTTGEYLYVARVAAALMLGWTILLIWTVQNPLERRVVLLITACPVVIGLVIAGILAVTSGFIDAANMVPIWVINGIILIIFSLAYYFAMILVRNRR